MSKGKYLIFIAVLFLTSCIVFFNDYELQPKNYVINKEFDEVVFDMDFINTKQEMINKLKQTNTKPVHCESSEKTYVIELLGFVDSESSDIKNSQSDRLTGSVRLCSNDDRFNFYRSFIPDLMYRFF